jgi:hypothetical protein
MGSTHDDLSIPTDGSYDRSFGDDRHDLRSPLLDQENERVDFMSRAAQVARRILHRAPAPSNDGAALSRVAAAPARKLRS